jgi:transcriptional regulator with XRE-family HTH domain
MISQAELMSQRLRELRGQQGWTQQELADLAGLERKSIIRYENAQSRPTGRALLALAELFGVSTDYLLGLSEQALARPEAEGPLSPVEKEALAAFRRARTDEERVRLLEALHRAFLAEGP